MRVEELMREIDVNVKKLVEAFAFLFKYRILFRGTGVEFAGLKEYVAGEDDATKIDWKASLRTQRLYVKQYEEERDLDIFILVDASASMLFGSQEKLKYEYAAILAGSLAFAALENRDNVGFAMFNEKIIGFIEPSQEIANYYHMLENLSRVSNYGGRCKLGDALTFVLNNLAEKTVLFVISDFIGLDEKWRDGVKMVSAKFDRVIGIMVRDLRDTYLPKEVGYLRFQDPFSGKILTVNVDKIRKKFEEEAKKQEKEVEEEFLRSGAGFVKIYTHEPFIEPLIRYLELWEEY